MRNVDESIAHSCKTGLLPCTQFEGTRRELMLHINDPRAKSRRLADGSIEVWSTAPNKGVTWRIVVELI